MVGEGLQRPMSITSWLPTSETISSVTPLAGIRIGDFKSGLQKHQRATFRILAHLCGLALGER